MNHVNEFIPVNKFTKENDIPEKIYSQFTLSKALIKSKEITARDLYEAFEKSIESRIIE